MPREPLRGVFFDCCMNLNIKHKVIDLFVFGGLFFVGLLFLRSKAVAAPVWFRHFLIKCGFIKDGNSVVRNNDIITNKDIVATNPDALTSEEKQWLAEKGIKV